MTQSGLQIIYTPDEVDFIQNLVFYIEVYLLNLIFWKKQKLNLIKWWFRPLIELQILEFGKEETKPMMENLN